MGLAILNLDIKKAFDTISYAYITKVLAAYGFGPQFQQWLHLLYNDITAQVRHPLKTQGFTKVAHELLYSNTYSQSYQQTY